MYRNLALAPGFRGAVLRYEFLDAKRDYTLGGCPPKRPPPGTICPPRCTRPQLKTVEPQIIPQKACRGPIPLNPCCPQFPKGNFRKYRSIFFFFGFPVIFLLSLRLASHDAEKKEPCYEFEYMRRRTKRFPWGEGVKSFFHNDHTNSLPGDCLPKPPATDCH